MTNLDSILKSRDITLPTKVHLVKAMVFPVVREKKCKYSKSGILQLSLGYIRRPVSEEGERSRS